MRYCKSFRERVVGYVRGGGSKSEASRRYGVTRQTIDRWLGYGNDVGQYRKPGRSGGRRIDDKALLQRVKSCDDILQKELAVEFGVNEATIHRALKRLGISRKKNVDIC